MPLLVGQQFVAQGEQVFMLKEKLGSMSGESLLLVIRHVSIGGLGACSASCRVCVCKVCQIVDAACQDQPQPCTARLQSCPASVSLAHAYPRPCGYTLQHARSGAPGVPARPSCPRISCDSKSC